MGSTSMPPLPGLPKELPLPPRHTQAPCSENFRARCRGRMAAGTAVATKWHHRKLQAGEEEVVPGSWY